MSDAALVAVAFIVIAYVPMDVYAASYLLRKAMERPAIPALTLYAGLSIGVAVAATAFALMAISTIVRIGTGDPLIPPGGLILILLIGVNVVSIPNLFLLRQLRRWDGRA